MRPERLVGNAVDRLGALDDYLHERGVSRPAAAVLALTVLGSLARLALLGERVAHYDEGRVAYWAMHYMRTGEFHYRFIIHGPLVQHVNAAVFSVFGANDVTMRLVVALIGGLLPLSVLLFRRHLRGSEMVAAAFFLTANPILWYYSRFFRSTIPLAAFAFVSFGTLVRYYDTRRPRYVHAAVVLLALGFAAKENAVVYLVVWLGAAALLLDHELFRPRTANTGFDWLWTRLVAYLGGGRWRRSVPRFVEHALAAGFLFGVVILFFYAPRAGTPDGLGLYNALADPGTFPEVIDATIADMRRGYEYWLGGATEAGASESLVERYASFLGYFFSSLSHHAAPLMAFAVFGFVIERYASPGSRNLVMFTAYWGFVSVLGYPLGADIRAAWITINALVPLAIPAGVALALPYRWGIDALEDGDLALTGIATFVLVLVVGYVAVSGAATVYDHRQPRGTGPLVQYAQPSNDLRPTLRDMGTLAAENEGVDVLFYGDHVIRNRRGDGVWQRAREVYPPCANLGNTLPLQWYIAVHDADATCARTVANLTAAIEEGPPPVVIAHVDDDAPVAARLPNYDTRVVLLRTSGGKLAYYVDESRLPA